MSRIAKSQNKQMPPQELTWEDIKEWTNSGIKIGEGNFGKVYEGYIDGKRLAIKVADSDENKRQQWKAEVEYLSAYTHQNFIRLAGYGESLKDKKLFLVYDYMPSSLSAKLQVLSWTEIMKILVQAASALGYINGNNRVFADFKPDNIMLDEGNNVKLSDFGGITPTGKMINIVTAAYAAPEAASGKGNEKTDVYSFGVTMLQVIMKIDNVGVPKHNEQQAGSSRKARQEKKQSKQEEVEYICETAKKLAQKNRVVAQELRENGCNEITAREITQLAMKCVEKHPNSRPSINEVIATLNQINSKN